MPDYKSAPIGVPSNPLYGVPMDAMLPYKHGYRPPQFMPMETFRPPRLENPGITNAGGIPASSPPETMLSPAPVSALDPAYSMHPIVKALSSQGGLTIPQYYPTTFMQQPLGRRNLSKTNLVTALGLPGLGGQTESQGMDLAYGN